jgi:hypothetical protein
LRLPGEGSPFVFPTHWCGSVAGNLGAGLDRAQRTVADLQPLVGIANSGRVELKRSMSKVSKFYWFRPNLSLPV